MLLHKDGRDSTCSVPAARALRPGLGEEQGEERMKERRPCRRLAGQRVAPVATVFFLTADLSAGSRRLLCDG